MSRIITVFGATGKQGGSVVNAILADGTFSPRAATRNPDSDASKKLKARGVEVVKADLSDKESVKKAVVGSEGVFGVTAPSMTGSDTEFQQGKNMVDASKEAGVKLFVWSSLPSFKKISNGKYANVHPFENKALVDEYLGTSGLPHAILHIGGFAENIYTLPHLKKIDTPSGPSYTFFAPRSEPTYVQPETCIGKDLGPSVLALFKNYKEKPGQILGQTFIVATQQISFGDLIKIISDALGKPIQYKRIETTTMIPIDEMYDHVNEFGMYRDAVIPDPRLLALGVRFTSLKEFVEEEVKPRFV